MKLTNETMAALNLKFEGAPAFQRSSAFRRSSFKKRALFVVEGAGAGSVRFLNEEAFENRIAFLGRQEERRLAAAYVAKGRGGGEARRLAKEDIAAARNSPIASYVARGPLTFNPFSKL